jgi:hypothetical protein
MEPSRTKPAPMTKTPTMTDALRLIVSATTPVGTSNTNVLASSAVPTSTSWSGSRSACTIRYTAEIVAIVARKRPNDAS